MLSLDIYMIVISVITTCFLYENMIKSCYLHTQQSKDKDKNINLAI